MKVYYSILTHDNGDNLIYRGLASSAINASEFLLSEGNGYYSTHIKPLCEGTITSNRVVLIRHLVEEEVLLTPDLLKILELAGTKQAEALLKKRKENKK